MAVLAAFPDTVKAVCQALEAAFEGLHADTVTPPDFTGVLPFARVTCHGGGDVTHTDTSRLTIDYFDATYALAQPGVEAVRQFIIQRGGFRIGDVVIDAASTDTRPFELQWNDANYPRRFVYDCSVATRR